MGLWRGLPMKSSRAWRWGMACVLSVGLALVGLLPPAGLADAEQDKSGSGDKKFPTKAKPGSEKKGRGPARTTAPKPQPVEPFLRTYSVPGGAAKSLATLLQQIYQES